MLLTRHTYHLTISVGQEFMNGLPGPSVSESYKVLIQVSAKAAVSSEA